MTEENDNLPPRPSSYAPEILSKPISRRQDWWMWDRAISRLEEKCRKLKADIAMTNPIWIRTSVRPPRAEDAIEGCVWTWTDPEGAFTQTTPYNSARWQDVVEYPQVYPQWMRITKVIP